MNLLFPWLLDSAVKKTNKRTALQTDGWTVKLTNWQTFKLTEWGTYGLRDWPTDRRTDGQMDRRADKPRIPHIDILWTTLFFEKRYICLFVRMPLPGQPWGSTSHTWCPASQPGLGPSQPGLMEIGQTDGWINWWMNEWMNERMDGKYQHSAELCPLSGPLPCFPLKKTKKTSRGGQGNRWPFDAFRQMVKEESFKINSSAHAHLPPCVELPTVKKWLLGKKVNILYNPGLPPLVFLSFPISFKNPTTIITSTTATTTITIHHHHLWIMTHSNR